MGHDADDGVRAETVEVPVEFETVATGLEFPEGPIAMPDGSVVLVEIKRGTLSRVAPDGTVSVVAELGGGPNGAAIGPDGAVYVCNNGAFFDYVPTDGLTVPHAGSAGWEQGSIQRVDLDTGASTTLFTHADGHRLAAPNDIVFDRHGGFWFTDHGVHATGDEPDGRGSEDGSGDAPGDDRGPASVLYATADGTVIRGVIWGLDATNGIGLSPDGTRLVVAETYRGRLWAFDVVGPGQVHGSTPADGELLYDVQGTALFDSLAVTADGSVCVATLLTGGISMVRPSGWSVQFVPVGDPLTTNICFGGDDLATAWVTSSGTGRLLRARWPQPGLGLAH